MAVASEPTAHAADQPVTALDDRVAHLARMPQLLIACDYDGTIAPIVDDPMHAAPRRETVVAMRSLADLPQTHVAVISGRSLRDLATLSRLPDEIRLVGSHGSEFDVGFGAALDDDALALRRLVLDSLRDIGGRHEGAYVEPKPTGVAFHYRKVDAAEHDDVLEAVEQLARAHAGLHVKTGSMVIEISVVELDKGRALDEIRRQVGASAVLYIGDDLTDEDAFATLAGSDVGVKVGDAPTQAEFSVAGTDDVARILAHLSDLRRSWLMGSAAVPIEAHSLLSDQRTAAIVAPDARVTWMCVPRIDSGAVFAELVGGPAAGFFAIRPAEGGRPISQRYEDGTLLLESTWPRMRVLDAMDCSGGLPTTPAGRTDLIRTISGSGRAVVEFAPRLDFGRVATRIEHRPEGLEVTGTTDRMVMRSVGVEWQLVDDGVHHTAVAEIDLDHGPVTLELRCGTDDLDEGIAVDRRVDETREFWTSWSSSLRLPEVQTDLVETSAIVLRALVHGPTGAVVAAPTTSLPECIGGIRNWDYRYCWLRDAALSVTALVRLGSHTEALAYLDWVIGVVEARGDLERIAPLFNVAGHHLPPEAEIAELPGYAGSRPVRVGNAADSQIQLDVFGPVVDLVHHVVEAGAEVPASHLQLVRDMADAVSRRWRDPDHGIWEARKPPRHHTHTKTMCWVTLDRAIDLAGRFGDDVPETWVRERDAIVADVEANAFKLELRSYGAAYDGSDLDASVLAIGTYGMVDPRGERFAGTVAAIEAILRDGPTVYRYRSDDGLPGREGGWHFMASWLVDAYLAVGRRDDAEALFADVCRLAGPTGLLSEEYDPETGRALGNHPQAYSHLGVINNALNLDG